jgi:hypothetical protein
MQIDTNTPSTLAGRIALATVSVSQRRPVAGRLSVLATQGADRTAIDDPCAVHPGQDGTS